MSLSEYLYIIDVYMYSLFMHCYFFFTFGKDSSKTFCDTGQLCQQYVYIYSTYMKIRAKSQRVLLKIFIQPSPQCRSNFSIPVIFHVSPAFVVEVFVLLDYSRSLVVCYRRFGTIQRLRQLASSSFWTSCPLKTKLITDISLKRQSQTTKSEDLVHTCCYYYCD